MRLDIETSGGPGWADLDRPRVPRALLVLTHGAGVGVQTADLLAIRDAAVAGHVAVALVTQPFRVAGRRTPPAPRPQDEAWLSLIAVLRRRRGIGALPLIVGGRSNGARVACRTASATGAMAVVALAFPLHPPPRATPSSAGGPPVGRPGKTRLEELASTGVPTLVVQGERDAFGMPPKARDRRLVVVPGADHSLKRDPAAVATAVLDFIGSLVGPAAVPAR